MVGPFVEEGDVLIREIIGDGIGGLCLSPTIRHIPAHLVDRTR